MAEKKTEASRQESLTTEDSRAEALRIEIARVEALRAENARLEVLLSEERKKEEEHAESLRLEAAKAREKRAEALRAEEAAISKKAEDAKKSEKYQREKSLQMVRGTFHFPEVPGGCLEFNLKLHKDDDPNKKWTFVDEQSYTVPLYVAKHLRTSGKYPEHAFAQGPDGKSSVKVSRMISRYSFEPDEFVPLEDIGEGQSSKIFTAENVIL